MHKLLSYCHVDFDVYTEFHGSLLGQTAATVGRSTSDPAILPQRVKA